MDQGQLRWADGAALTLALSPRVLRTAAGGAAHGHWGRRKARNDEERTKPAQVNQTKSNQIKPNQPKSNQIKPNPTKKNGPARINAQAVGSKMARTDLDLGRARCMRGNAERMNGKTKGLSDRSTFYIYDTDERGSGISEKSSLILGYVRLCSLM